MKTDARSSIKVSDTGTPDTVILQMEGLGMVYGCLIDEYGGFRTCTAKSSKSCSYQWESQWFWVPIFQETRVAGMNMNESV